MKNLSDNKAVRNITAMLLCALMVLGLTGCGLTAAGAAKENSTDLSENADAEAVEPASETQGTAERTEDTASDAIVKKETVYVLTDAEGTANRVIVSDWLSGSAGNGALSDVSNLSDIEVVEGNSTMTVDGNAIAWNAADGDVYYKGNSQEQVPVAVHVTYLLDGNEISAKDLAGRSGRVTIRFDYENRKSETAVIDGKETTLYAPFVMITGVLLNNDTFSDVTVTNGRLVNDGSRMAVVGWGFPGLAEDLGIAGENCPVPDHMEITADVKDFSLGMTVTVATNEVFRGLDVGKLDSLGDVEALIGQVEEAMKQLEDGSGALYEGLCKLYESTDSLSDGVGRLADGSKQLADGAKKAANGAESLADGAEKLKNGLAQLDSNSETLMGGAKEVFNGLLKEAQEQLTSAGLTVPTMTIDNYEKVLDGVIASLDKDAVYKQAEAEVKKAVEAKRGYIKEQVTAAVRAEVEKAVTEAVRAEVEAKVKAATEAKVREQVEAAVRTQVFAEVLKSVGMTPETYEADVAAGMIDEATQGQLSAATDVQMKSEPVRKMIDATVESELQSAEVTAAADAATDAQMAGEEVKAVIAKTTSDKMASKEVIKTVEDNTEAQVTKAFSDAMGSDEVKSKLEAAAAGAGKVAELKRSLNEYKRFYEGLQAYTAGVSGAADGSAALADGAKSLKKGNADLASGAEEVNIGLAKLHDGIPALTDGIRQLRDGAKELADGIGEFDDRVVKKIAGVFDGNITALTERVKAVAEIADAYDNFSGIADGMDGDVKFIIRTTEIGE